MEELMLAVAVELADMVVVTVILLILHLTALLG
jgi:hypothetical protein